MFELSFWYTGCLVWFCLMHWSRWATSVARPALVLICYLSYLVACYLLKSSIFFIHLCYNQGIYQAATGSSGSGSYFRDDCHWSHCQWAMSSRDSNCALCHSGLWMYIPCTYNVNMYIQRKHVHVYTFQEMNVPCQCMYHECTKALSEHIIYMVQTCKSVHVYARCVAASGTRYWRACTTRMAVF
jgi:hypothetical protein